MIHGDCSSRGCYAMTDEQIAEIYALARESFFGGQTAFQIQAYPFKMTPLNMARHRNSPHMAFWRMLKQGYDHFEVTRQEPKVSVCEKHYVFDAQGSGKFSPAGKCPAYTVPEEIVAAVQQRQQHENAQVAELVRKGTPTVAARTGTDGGMNPVFFSALSSSNIDSEGVVVAPVATKLGTIPANIRLPRDPGSGNVSTGATQVATASSSGGWFGGLMSSFSGQGADKAASEAEPTTASVPAPRQKPAAAPKTVQTASTTTREKTPPTSQQASAKPALGAIRPKPAQEASSEQASGPSLMKGAAPTVPSGGFDGRWGTFSQ
jgi:hypothetical protein